MKRYLILVLLLVFLASPAYAANYYYHYDIPAGQQICTEEDLPVNDYWAYWLTNNVSATLPNPTIYIYGNYHPFNATMGYWSTTLNNPYGSQCVAMPSNRKVVFITNNNGANWNFANYGSFYYNTSDPSVINGPPVVDYACNIPESFPYKNLGFGLVCTDNSTATPAITAVNWTLSQPDGSSYLTSNATLSKTLTNEGWYELEYQACNAYGCGYANTSQLVNVTSDLIPETGISFWVHTYDPITGAKIGPSDIGIGNTTSGGWRNSSTNLGTAKFDSTDYARLEKLTVGQNVNLCGEAPGYLETCTNVSIAYDGWEYILNLVRTDLVPAGNQSTMIVNVINSNTAQTISGVSLTISNSSVPYSSSKLSDSNGIATFSNIPAVGSYQIAASKTGYVSATKFWPVYPGEVSNAYIGMLPVGATPVPTSTGGNPIYETPVPTSTYGPGGTPDTRTDAEKDADMMNILRDNGEMLIQFFIVCFVVYMVMGMAGRGGR